MRARRLAHIVAMARLLNHITLLDLRGTGWADLDFLIADVVIVLLCLDLVLLVALA